MQEGLLINCTAYKVLRFVPPLTITQKRSTGACYLDKVLTPVTTVWPMNKRDLLNFRDLT
jgi:acetylornithine/succinyldiaminopimelate/putrescine aminotransferase